MPDWRTDVIRAVGGKPSSGTLAFLQGWGAKEGGFKHNTARFNWLNRIDTAYPSAGVSVKGIAAYPDYQTGVARTAELIRSGYPAIANSLRSGNVSFQNPAVQGDLNRWLSGKRAPGMTPYVQSVAKLSGLPGGGANMATAAGAPTPAPAPLPTPSTPQNGLATVMPLLAALGSRRQARQEGTRAPIGQLLGAIMGMRQQRQQMAVQQPPQAAAAAPGEAAGAASGGFLQAPTQWKATPHAGNATSNLGWGPTGPADIMAKPGTAVGAPEDGVIQRHGSAQGGSSLYFQGASGKTYWLGHVANSLPPGTRVRRGQVITYISPEHKNPHLHIDRR
jgi:murein DD-endopeptidase MepM/ murein hydrolase activator NlpD